MNAVYYEILRALNMLDTSKTINIIFTSSYLQQNSLIFLEIF